MIFFLLLALALSPEEVVRTVVDALQKNDSPMPNSGVYTAYKFASPANHAAAGPYGRFLRVAKSPDYAPLLRPHPVNYGQMIVAGPRAQQDVQISLEGADPAVFRFNLSLQNEGEFNGKWMVDGVVRVH